MVSGVYIMVDQSLHCWPEPWHFWHVACPQPLHVGHDTCIVSCPVPPQRGHVCQLPYWSRTRPFEHWFLQGRFSVIVVEPLQVRHFTTGSYFDPSQRSQVYHAPDSWWEHDSLCFHEDSPMIPMRAKETATTTEISFFMIILFALCPVRSKY